MYNSYPIVYETINNSNVYLVYLIIFGSILLLLILTLFISLSKIFKKANRSAFSAWVPIYNLLVLLEIVNLPKWYLILLLVPILNIYIIIKLYFNLAMSFRKSKLFAVELILFPFIFYPVLAFSNSEYIGINLMAREGKTTAAEVPVLVKEEDKNPIVHDEVDTKSANIGISIGGGVYQKNYTNNLLEVDKNQEIIKKPDLISSQTEKKQPLDFSKSSFITQTLDEPIKKETPPPTGINFPEPIIQKQNINNITQSALEGDESSQSLSNQNVEKPSFITCPKCGAKLKNGVYTCFLCGTKLNY